MKIQTTKSKIHSNIAKAEKITGKNATLPVLSCIILEAKGSSLVIRSTNLDLGIEISIPVKVQEEGVVAIPGNLLLSYISYLAEDDVITLESQNGNLLITSNKHETNIKAVAEEDFPNIPRLGGDKKFTIAATDLLVGLKSVWYASSTSSMKPELSSVYLYPEGNFIVFVATDSFRLAEKRIRVKNSEGFENILIPFKNVNEIIRVLDNVHDDVEVTFESNQISLESSGTYLLSRIVDGSFPDYGQIIPKDNTSEVIVLKHDLTQALRLSNVFSDKFNQISMVVRPDDSIFEIQSKNIDKGENKNVIQATLRGDSVEMRFNHKYIVDSFSSIDSDSLVLSFSGSQKPMVVRGVNDASFLYLVMPMNK